MHAKKVVVWQFKHCFCDVFVTVAVVLAKGLLKLLQGYFITFAISRDWHKCNSCFEHRNLRNG